MSDLSEAEKLEIIEWLAKWAGWPSKPFDGGIVVVHEDLVLTFEPFSDLNHARLLLEECERRGIWFRVTGKLWAATNEHQGRGIIGRGLLATAEQITLAVWAVVQGLEQGKDKP